MNDEQLRIAIAEKLGWKLKLERGREDKPPLWHHPYGFVVIPKWTSASEYAEREAPETVLPDYLNDPAAAILLVEHMDKAGYGFAHWKMNGCQHEVIFYPQMGPAYSGKSPTFPLAVARAFAAANNLNPQP